MLPLIPFIHNLVSHQQVRDLDLAISGDGYFVVKDINGESYTRAGNFYLDDAGTLVNSDGSKVQAYAVNANGDVSNVYGDVAINGNSVLSAKTSTQIGFTENLSSDSTIGSTYTQQIKVIDGNGESLNVSVNFRKSAADKWDVFINEDSALAAVTTAESNVAAATKAKAAAETAALSAVPTDTASTAAAKELLLLLL